MTFQVSKSFPYRPSLVFSILSEADMMVPTVNIGTPWLENRFDNLVQDPLDTSLQPLLPVIKGLMRFRPSDRLSASQALELIPEI